MSNLHLLNNKSGVKNFHQYSLSRDFERLINLISLLLKYPGINTTKEIQEKLITESISLYKADMDLSIQRINEDLEWLQDNSFIGDCIDFNASLKLNKYKGDESSVCQNQKRYDEKIIFTRLMKTLRFLAHKPLFTYLNSGFFTLEEGIWYAEYIQEEVKERLSEIIESLQLYLTKGSQQENKTKKKGKQPIKEKIEEINQKIILIKEKEIEPTDNIPLVYNLGIHLIISNVNFVDDEDIDISRSLHELLLEKNDRGEYVRSPQEFVVYLNSFYSNFRKDIELCLKPYKIFPEETMKNGYFLGTAIFSKEELKDIYERMILPHSEYVDELLAEESYKKVGARLGYKLLSSSRTASELNPIRKIGIHSIVDSEYTLKESLAKQDNLKLIEKTINLLIKLDLYRDKLEKDLNKGGKKKVYISIAPIHFKINKIGGSAEHSIENVEPDSFKVYPLFILFHNIAWYLAFEVAEGEERGKYKFERLDRLEFSDSEQLKKSINDLENKLEKLLAEIKRHKKSVGKEKQATIALQKQSFAGLYEISETRANNSFDFKSSLERINKMYNASPGIFLGSKEQQDKYFDKRSKRNKPNEDGTLTVELWFANQIYGFILEGIKRYDGVKMTAPEYNSEFSDSPLSRILQDYGNLKFDHRLHDLGDEERKQRKKQLKLQNIFKLKGTGDPDFPNKFTVAFPAWFIQDYDFRRWILGFGNLVKVVNPPEFRDEIKKMAQEISSVYE